MEESAKTNKEIDYSLYEAKPTDPIRMNHFLIDTDNIDIDELLSQSCSIPKFKNGKWKKFQITYIDNIGVPTSKKIFNKFIKNNQDPVNVKISILCPVGDVIQTWHIKAAIKEIDFGDYSYSKDGIVMVKITFKPISVELIPNKDYSIV